MKTCKYCGSALYFLGEKDNNVWFNCNYCDLPFKINNTSENRKRKNELPETYDTARLTTKELLEKNTIELFYMLKAYRSEWYETMQTVKSIKDLYEENGEDYEKDETFQELMANFEDLTKYKFVLENIIIEKAGYLPDKITEQFLDELMQRAKETPDNKMDIFIK